MNLSYKAIQFIIEAIDYRLEAYEERLKLIEDIDEDEASDIGNDCGFLEALRHDLVQTLQNRETVLLSADRTVRKDGSVSDGLSLPELFQPVLQLSMSDRLLLVDAIAESIRQETLAPGKSETASEETFPRKVSSV
ncbi:MAG: hypothetical protein GDA43_14100 [Hormoscilla sp. SP5CHS1]|nr:hypothetical protein [Hormoscilla sp. SP12CHS1]MBC6454181.1 hypothetical protein [Hormoscilla sp. SP5CHS1]